MGFSNRNDQKSLSRNNLRSLLVPPNCRSVKYPLWWHAPFWSGSGYGTEATNFILSTLRSTTQVVRQEDLWIKQHGDGFKKEAVESMVVADHRDLLRMELQPKLDDRPAVVVCHSLPWNWKSYAPGKTPDDSCPPDPLKHPYVYLIGRMPKAFVKYCNAMDEIWVPSDFSKKALVMLLQLKSHISDLGRSSLLRRGLYVESSLLGALVFGSNYDREVPDVPDVPDDQYRHTAGLPKPSSGMIMKESGQGQGTIVYPQSTGSTPYRFISTYKWEACKRWDVLLQGKLLTFDISNDAQPINAWARRVFFKKHEIELTKIQAEQRTRMAAALQVKEVPERLFFNMSDLPKVYLIDKYIRDEDLPRLYKAADAFVLPSRGEGWGRPHVEAMAMGMPVISTNWSGMTAYLDEDVGYPIKVENLLQIPNLPSWGWFRGQVWSQPCVAHMKELMRHVVENPDKARMKGEKARERMIERYSPDVIARTLVKEIHRIDALISK
eukprot:gene22388-29495_t